MRSTLQSLDALAPLGYRVGTHIRFATPLFTRCTMAQSWQDDYARHGYAMRDPMVFWGISNAGAIRWSEIALPDPFGILRKAAEHGLKYGMTASCGKITSRTLVGAARDDREFANDEMVEILRIAETLHEISQPPRDLTPTMIEALRVVGHGERPADAAARLGISEDALAERLSAAREHLGATTMADALRKAREHKLI